MTQAMSDAPAPTSDRPVVVIGAGPHGLAAVAHLRGAGVPVRAFGEPLAFWRETMPAGMWLRSAPRASSISDPADALTLARWGAEQDRKIDSIVPIGDFIEYGTWFQQRAAPDLDRRLVASVRRDAWGFAVTLADGEQISASRVVVAAGLAPFAYVPPLFADMPPADMPPAEMPPALVSHACATPDLERFAGRAVAVIGAGQSALESAALLHEAGAEVEVIGRTPAIFWLGDWSPEESAAGDGSVPAVPSTPAPVSQSWRARHGIYWRPAPTDVGGRLTSWVGAAPDVVRHLPRPVRAPLTYHCIRPAGAYWLPERLRAVTITLGRSVARVSEREDRVALALDDGSSRTVDHVLLGTGYAIDVRRYPFLDPALAAQLRVVQGSPVLRRGLESSVPGLHFLGAPAAESFGPVMRFVVGTSYTAPALAQGILGSRRPLFRWAF